MKWIASGLVLATALALPMTPAWAADWKSDPAASRLEFVARFQNNPVPGQFKDFDVRLRFDPAQPQFGQLEVRIRVASADMGTSDINTAIAGADWFDFAKRPQAVFQSESIRPAGTPGRYLATGTLELKGQRQPVEVPFSFEPAGEGASMGGEFNLQRGKFGIGLGEWTATDVVGADVQVKFRVRLRAAAG